MDVLYAQEEASAADVQQHLPRSPSYSAVRALLRNLVDKGHVTFRQDGARYLYRAVVAKSVAAETALQRLVNTFFAGRPADVVLNLLGEATQQIDQDDLADIERAIKRLQRESRNRK